MAVVLDSSTLPITIAVFAAVVGFVVGVGARSLVSKPAQHKVREAEPPPTEDRDRERFFRFTWLVLDVLPCYLRVHFKSLWDSKYASVLPPWSDSERDGEALWNGVYNNEPLGMLKMTEGKYVATPEEFDVELLSPRSKLRIEGLDYRVVSTTESNPSVHLNHKAPSSGVFEAFDQMVEYEQNCDPRMAKLFGAKALTGDTNLWDTSLLCFSLLQSSHKLLVDSEHRAHVEGVRNLRNNKLAHIRGCRMDRWEMMEAVNIMDLYVSSNLPSRIVAEWCHASRQVLHEVVSMPRMMPPAGDPEPQVLMIQDTRIQEDRQPLQQQQQQAQATQQQSLLMLQDTPRQVRQQARAIQQHQLEASQPAALRNQSQRASAQQNPPQNTTQSAAQASQEAAQAQAQNTTQSQQTSTSGSAAQHQASTQAASGSATTTANGVASGNAGDAGVGTNNAVTHPVGEVADAVGDAPAGAGFAPTGADGADMEAQAPVLDGPAIQAGAMQASAVQAAVLEPAPAAAISAAAPAVMAAAAPAAAAAVAAGLPLAAVAAAPLALAPVAGPQLGAAAPAMALAPFVQHPEDPGPAPIQVPGAAGQPSEQALFSPHSLSGSDGCSTLQSVENAFTVQLPAYVADEQSAPETQGRWLQELSTLGVHVDSMELRPIPDLEPELALNELEMHALL